MRLPAGDGAAARGGPGRARRRGPPGVGLSAGGAAAEPPGSSTVLHDLVLERGQREDGPGVGGAEQRLGDGAGVHDVLLAGDAGLEVLETHGAGVLGGHGGGRGGRLSAVPSCRLSVHGGRGRPLEQVGRTSDGGPVHGLQAREDDDPGRRAEAAVAGDEDELLAPGAPQDADVARLDDAAARGRGSSGSRRASAP